jgi:adenine-specific DNA-methyltransferase
MTAKQDEYREEILATGVIGKAGEKLEFTRVEAAPATFVYIQAMGETKEDNPRKVAIHFGSETKVLDAGRVEDIFDEVQSMRPTPQIIIIAAYQFDPEATKLIEETKWPDMQIFAVQMNTDLMTGDLKKKRSSNQSFFFIGQPDVELIHDGRTKDVYKVRVNGFDYYDPKTGKVKSGNANNIAMWMLDEDYDGSCIEPEQIFFPMGGKSGGWHKLAKTLKAEIDKDAIEQYAGNVSLPFKIKPGQKKVAVKIIDDRGIESMKVLKVGEDNG